MVRRGRRYRKWFVPEGFKALWARDFNRRRKARKAAKQQEYLARTGQTAEEHAAKVAARRALKREAA